MSAGPAWRRMRFSETIVGVAVDGRRDVLGLGDFLVELELLEYCLN